MQLLPLSVIVALLAGLLYYFTTFYGILCWPAFVGWAIFFLLGSNKEAITKAMPPMLVGLILGYLTVVVNTMLQGDLFILSVLVVILAFFMVFMMNIPWLAAAPAAFLAAASYFGVGDPIKTAVPLFIGLFVGYFSVWITEVVTKPKSNNTQINS